MLSKDNAGNETFVGLTVEESQEYDEFIRLDRSTDGDGRSADRYLELHEKHERARLAVLAAESQAQHDTSPRH
jgi:hypothetical protein